MPTPTAGDAATEVCDIVSMPNVSHAFKRRKSALLRTRFTVFSSRGKRTSSGKPFLSLSSFAVCTSADSPVLSTCCLPHTRVRMQAENGTAAEPPAEPAVEATPATTAVKVRVSYHRTLTYLLQAARTAVVCSPIVANSARNCCALGGPIVVCVHRLLQRPGYQVVCCCCCLYV